MLAYHAAMPQVRKDTVRQDYFVPFAGDGFALVSGLTASDLLSTMTVNGADVATTLSDDDGAAPTAGQVKVKEVGSTGRYSVKFLADTVSSMLLVMEYTAGVLRFKQQYDVVQQIDIDPASTEKITLKLRDGAGTGVANARYDVKTSTGVRVLIGFVDGNGDVDLFLPVGTGFKVQAARADLTFAETTFNVVAGTNSDLTVTGTLSSLALIDPIEGTTFVQGLDATLKVEFRHPVTSALVDPDSVDQLEVIDTDGSTVLETISSGSIVKAGTGKYQVVATGGNLDAAGMYQARWTYKVDSGDVAVATSKDVIVQAVTPSGLDPSDLCAVSGTFLLSDGKAAANMSVAMRHSATIIVGGSVLSGTSRKGVTDKDGKLTISVARGVSARIEIPRLGIDKTVVVPAAATADFATLLA